MRRQVAACIACALLFGRAADAHRIDEYLQATLLSLETGRVHASMRLIPGTLVADSVIAAIDADGDGTFSDAERRAYALRVLRDQSVSIDGRALELQLLSWNFPPAAQMREGLGEIHIEYAADLPDGTLHRRLIVANHHRAGSSVYLANVLVPEDPTLHVAAQQRNAAQSTYAVGYEQSGGAAFPTLFRLGMHHIAQGTDHLLFLLTLLLPAPLLVAGRRWGPPAGVRRSLLRVLGIVSAFTVGHSLTLALAALGKLAVPGRPIEVLIAVSIVVSAWHAWRPIAAGREAWIAGFFGLIHGLAFAATLDHLGLGFRARVEGVLAFNLGIEAMQLIAVAALLPTLISLSRSRVYSVVRIGGAAFGGAAAVGWMIERAFDVTGPVDAIVDAMAARAMWIAGALLVLSLVCRARLISAGSPARERRFIV